MEFNIDNYECLSVSGSVYEYAFTNEMIYVSVFDEDTTKLVLLKDYEGKYNERELVVLVQGGSGFLCRIGYYSVGWFVRNSIVE